MGQSKAAQTKSFDELNRKLDRLGQCAPDCMTPGTPLYERWKNDIWYELYAAYVAPCMNGDQEMEVKCQARNDLVMEFIERSLPNYSSQKASLSHYWIRIYNLAKGRHEANNRSPLHESLQCIDEEGNEYENPNIPHDVREVENKTRQDGYWIEAMAKILLHLQRSTRIRKNSTAPLFFPMWFAEMTTHYTQDANGFSSDHEREIFEAMCLPYLDYFMSEPCRTILRLRDVPLRKAAEIDPNAAPGERLSFRSKTTGSAGRSRKEKRTCGAPSEYFLKPVVPVSFLHPDREIRDYTVSKSRTEYLRFLEDELLPERT